VGDRKEPWPAESVTIWHIHSEKVHGDLVACGAVTRR
jgi:hypothetical protein